MKSNARFSIHDSQFQSTGHFFSLIIHRALSIVQWTLFFFLFSCANQVAPTGGNKDVKPPKVLKYIPENYSTNVKTHDIVITFDEFIALKDINTQLVVSPPLKYLVQTKIRKKSLLIHIQDTLQREATYTMNFGNAITDLHEGNVLENFQYVFSTGDIIDSLTISGKVENAFDKKTEKGIYAMLYYVIDTAKTEQKANESEKRIYELLYHIIDSLIATGTAQDAFDNKTKIYSVINHVIDSLSIIKRGRSAFTTKTEKGIYAMFYHGKEDSLPLKNIPDYFAKTNDAGEFQIRNVSPGDYKIVALKDNNSDYLFNSGDEAIAFNDSFITAGSTGIKMELFKELPKQQPLKSYSEEPGKAIIAYSRPLTNVSDRITFLSDTSLLHIYSITGSTKKDTLTIWYRNQLSDSLSFVLNADTAKEKKDTITIRLRKADTKGKLKYNPVLSTQYESKSDNTLELGRPLNLLFNHPVEHYDLKNISLTEDSLPLKNLNILFIDTLKRILRINYKWKEKSKYSLLIPKETLTDILGIKNDTILLNFKTKSITDYGTLSLKMRLPANQKQYLVQLIDDKETVFRQSITQTDTTLQYDYLDPKVYRIKVIEDSNKNGEWDTGNYLKHLQPERISYYKENITVRANWDVDVKWNLEE